MVEPAEAGERDHLVRSCLRASVSFTPWLVPLGRGEIQKFPDVFGHCWSIGKSNLSGVKKGDDGVKKVGMWLEARLATRSLGNRQPHFIGNSSHEDMLSSIHPPPP